MTLILDPPADLLPDVVDDGTRREFVVGGLSLGALLLAGCGDADSDSDGAASAEDGFPITITHKYGSARIPAQPQRVACVGYTEHESVLALGVKPVLVRELSDYRYGFGPWAQDELGAATPAVMPSDSLKFEQIAATRPELIIGTWSGMTEPEYRKLSRIAPTIAQSADYVDFGMPWEEQLRVIGRALGRADSAASVAARIEARFVAARQEHRVFAGRSAMMASRRSNEDIFVMGPQDPRVRLVNTLGFKTPRLAGKGIGTYLSTERSRMLEADVLLYFKFDAKQRDPLFERLDVVRDGRTLVLPARSETFAAMGYSAPLSIPYVLDQLVPRLAAALDDDPATKVAPVT